MEIATENCCRACLKTDQAGMRTMNDMWSGDLTFLGLYESLLGSEISDRYSNYLCELCEKRLVDAYLFKVQCLESISRVLKGHWKQPTAEDDEIFDQSVHVVILENLVVSPSSKSVKEEVEKVELVETSSSPTANEVENPKPLQILEADEDTRPLRFACLKCSVRFKDYQGYQRHYRQLHRIKQVCEECGKLVARQNLDKHRLSHSRPQHVCDVCGKAFALKENLTKHIRIHERNHQYKCEFCGKAFIHYNSKRSHVISQHTKEKKYECRYCGSKFASSSNMLRHVRYHTKEVNHICSFCSKGFNTSSELKNHVATHSKEKNENCHICEKSFGTRRNLRNHLKTHAGDRDYVCPVCAKAFTQAHVLRTHLKCHPDYPTPPRRAILSRKRLETHATENKPNSS